MDVNPDLVPITAVLLTLSFSAWGLIAYRSLQKMPLVRFAPRRLVPWTVLEICFAAMIVMFVLGSVGLVLKYALDIDISPEVTNPQKTRALLLVNCIFNLALFGILLAGFRRVAGASWNDLGISKKHIVGDLWLGTLGSWAVFFPVYAINYAAILYFDKPAVHPLIENIATAANQEQPDWSLLVLSGIAAVIVAPLFEELFFRGLFQGWLESVAQRLSTKTENEQTIGVVEESIEMEEGRPLEKPFDEKEIDRRISEMTDEIISPEQLGWLATYGPIVISSLFFAAMHSGVWPSPIPLFALALALGYVYHRTHRLLPCIVIHLLFNSYSFFAVLVPTLSK